MLGLIISNLPGMDVVSKKKRRLCRNFSQGVLSFKVLI